MSSPTFAPRYAHKSASFGLFKKSLLGTTILAGLVMTPVGAGAADPTTVTEIGTLGGVLSRAYAVTDNGLVVGEGYVDAIIGKPFRWTSAGGLINMGTFGGSRGYASGVSANGTVIVGYADMVGDWDYYAFRWTQGGGMVNLGALGGTFSKAQDVSSDGAIVVGIASTGVQQHAFRWTQGDGMDDLFTLGGDFSSALAISGDGTVITGTAQTAANAAQYAFRWTQGDGMVSLGALGGTVSVGKDVSFDGSVIVGYSQIAGGTHHAFRWTQAGGMVDLGLLGGTWGYANAVSADGSIVVGHSFIAGNAVFHAFRWTEAGGIKDLNTLLSDAGVDMTGITLSQANAISPNGKYIAGEGSFPGFTAEAFVVYYDGVAIALTAASQQQEATQNLATNQQTMLAESRSTAGQLLGFARPVDSNTYTYAGGMFGSAVGYTGGQFSGKGVTLLGGIGYGAQDYKNIEQDNATTVAVAGRYTFNELFAGQKNLSPFVELGGWVTPNADLTMSRPYGTGSSVGVGATESTSYAGYARGGLAWDINANDKLTGYGELGQQFMKFKAYSETVGASNPFPATVNEGLVRMDVVRAGGAWTHKVGGLNMPVSFTLAGAAAHAFDGQSGLNVNVAGIGTSTAAFKSSTWGEFSAGVETQLTERTGLILNINGTTGSKGIGTEVHGGAGVTFKF